MPKVNLTLLLLGGPFRGRHSRSPSISSPASSVTVDLILSLSSCLTAPSLISFVQYIHHPFFAHVKLSRALSSLSLSNSVCSFLILSLLVILFLASSILPPAQPPVFLSPARLQTTHHSRSHCHLANFPFHSCCYPSVTNLPPAPNSHYISQYYLQASQTPQRLL